MPFIRRRALSIFAAALTAVALGAAPALAGEDDDESDDDSPAQVQIVPSTTGASSVATPQGGVATGFGGTAAQNGPDLLTLGLGGGAVALALACGGMAVARRGAS